MYYPVNEVFETLQGEGVFTGVPAIFVRLQGCPVGCPWCDTRQTWDKLEHNQVKPADVIRTDGSIGRWALHDAKSLLEAFKLQGFNARHIVITGGEPCLYPLTEMTEAFNAAGFRTQIETSGTFEVNCSADTWVTVSPKVGMKGGCRYCVRRWSGQMRLSIRWRPRLILRNWINCCRDWISKTRLSACSPSARRAGRRRWR